MNLTFKGHMKSYCRELSEQDSLSLRKLLNLACTTHPRLVEPLFVFASCLNKEVYLLKLTKNTNLHEHYQDIYKKSKQFEIIEDFLQSENCPQRYKNVYSSYLAQFDTIESNRRICGLLRDTINNAIKSNNITIYQICKALNLNKGNVYAYLSGDNTKVSKELAYSILEFVS